MVTPTLLDEIRRFHFPEQPATADEISAFEARSGWSLDPDLRAFYQAFNGARLFRDTCSPYRLLPLSEVVRARVAILGPRRDRDEFGPSYWHAICDMQDGNYVALDVGSPQAGAYPLRDCFRESFPDHCRIVAGSFGEFLERALRSEGFSYWL
ncbi:MAG TPA: SMI1/KNR4 family protein [Myxococcaceae bacterium]|nr:SMI1/KNR4 family protein [Myxococcaceae bacterium]